MPVLHFQYDSWIQGRMLWALLCLCTMLMCPEGLVTAGTLEGEAIQADDLTALSLEQLMSIEVTSVSKKAQKISKTTAAIHVITEEDIRRSGATNIPDLLRMVPGVQVARIDSNKWAITSRGFNGRFANKLLVLIDGRTVYDPTFSGVFWDVQDTLLEDIDRIEVIRGPGATLWGANAVNGVINIMTKHAKDTQGGLLIGSAGSQEQGLGGVRYGGQIDEKAYARGYFKYFNRGSFDTAGGDDARDDMSMYRGGGRIDWKPTSRDALTFQGDWYAGQEDSVVFRPALSFPFRVPTVDDISLYGGNILGRWQHEFSSTSDAELQIYYDRTDRHGSQLDMGLDTLDVDFQHRLALGDRHDVIWGAGYRLYQDTLMGDAEIQFDKDHRTTHRVGFFIQDEIKLIDDRLSCLVGTKLEENSHSGIEVQPNVRVLYTPHPNHAVWGAISRAVRTPSRGEVDAQFAQRVIPGQVVSVVTLLGNEDFESEELLAYEMGYRWQATSALSFDLALFYNDYDKLFTLDVGRPYFNGRQVIIPVTSTNQIEGTTYGVELVADWHPSRWWHLQAAYTFLRMNLDTEDGSNDSTTVGGERESPRHQFSLRSMVNLPKDIQLDGWLRYVDAVPNGGIAPYITLDARLAWRPIPNLELALIGQNLLDKDHPEFSAEILDILSTEVPRSFYGKITWQF